MTDAPKISLADLMARTTKLQEDAQLAKMLRDDAKQAVKNAKTVDAKAAARRELEAANAEARKLENEGIWEASALILRVKYWTCTCGAHGKMPQGIFIRYTNGLWPTAHQDRAVRSESEGNQLPRRQVIEGEDVVICHNCAPSHGFTAFTKG